MNKISEVKYHLNMMTGSLIITLNDNFKLKESVFNNAIISSDIEDNIVEIELLNIRDTIEKTITGFFNQKFKELLN